MSDNYTLLGMAMRSIDVSEYWCSNRECLDYGKKVLKCKKRVGGHVVEVVKRVVFGDPDEVLGVLCADSDGTINTLYVERLNLTIRNSLARFIRKTMNESKDPVMH